MGKQRFRLSHMIPNAWFYRLRDMNTSAACGTTTTHNKKPLSTPTHQHNQPRNSFCYTPKVHQVYISPSNRNNISKQLPSSKHVLGSIYIQPVESSTHNDHEVFLSPNSSSYYESPLYEPTRSLDKPPSPVCSYGVMSSSITEVKIEFNNTSYTGNTQASSGYETELQKPPPIITKPTKYEKVRSTIGEKNEETCSQSSISFKIVDENISKKETSGRKTVSRVKIRSNSLKMKVGKRVVHCYNNQKNFASNCCIVKSTFDPKKDLKESMMEMIVENNIRTSKDLKKLLFCYLSLNSNEYHDLIIKAFEEVWLTFNFVV